jgi:hypothetical protein
MRKRTTPAIVRRILSRLSAAEALEVDPWFRDDLRIARLTVAYAARGEAVLCAPDVLASYVVLGLHPEKVWPAIQARRTALGPVCDVPKKPPQAVKLWSEKTNGARAVNSRAGITLLRDNTISVPMAAPSIAALYPKPDASSSAKTRRFSYDEMLAIVEFSGAPHSIRQATLSALKARGRWPNEDGPATGVVCISLIGMMLHGVCCRSTARWRTRRAVKLGYWRRLRDANSWSNCPKCGTERDVATCHQCGYVGRAKTPEGKANFDEFCRPFMYEIDIEKFRTAPRCRELRHFDARTYAEYKEAAKRGEHGNVTEMPRKPSQPAPPPVPPAPAAPLPKREKPAAETTHTIRLKGDRTEREIRRAIVSRVTHLMRSGEVSTEGVLRERSLALAPSSARGAFPTNPDPWTLICERLRKRLDRHGHDTWLQPARFKAVIGRSICVTIPSADFLYGATQKYAGPIQEAVSELQLPCDEIIFEWREQQREAPMAKPDAIRKACEEMGVPLEEALRVTGWTMGESGKEQES